jgi:asparaginyl-tRNA synthetase
MGEEKFIYICATAGDDDAGDGSELKPLKTLFRAMQLADSSSANFLVSVPPPKDTPAAAKGSDQKQWDKPSKSAMKKAVGRWEEERRKREKAGEKSTKVTENNEKRLEESKKIQFKLDPSLPEATKAKIYECKKLNGERVKVFAFVHRIRQQRTRGFSI